MTPMRMGAREAATVTGERLAEQADALAAAVACGGAQLPADLVANAQRLVEKVAQRTSIAGSHTVVALAGATGSGKSSLFNALVGSPVAQVGARRPTTSAPTAAVWGAQAATALLDWLGVAARHSVPEAATDEAAVGRLDGLVVLDLPDFDSRVQAHRAEARRVLELVDVFVWVTDPQKYADALLHEDYLRALARHEGVTLVVLNQADRLEPSAVQACRADLERLLSLDGMPAARVLVTSARTGWGVEQLRQRLANAVAGAHAARHRLHADIVAVASGLRAGVADAEPDVAASPGSTLVDALVRSAGVPVVLDAVELDYRRAAGSHGGWLFTRWVPRLRPDPLSRLRVDRAVVPIAGVGDRDVRAVLGRSSIPAPSPSARSAVSLAIHELAHAAARGLPQPWVDAVTDAAAPQPQRLADELDRAVTSTPLRGRDPAWWRGFAALQWVAGTAALGGALWLTALAVLGWLQIRDVPTPTVGVLPWPLLLFAGGAGIGLVGTWVFRAAARRGARRRRVLVGRRLREAVAAVATAGIVDPVVAVLARHRGTREHLDRALGGAPSTPR